MQRITTVVITILLTITTTFGQKIEIGQDAKTVKYYITLTTQEHNQVDNNGNTSNSFWTSDTKYFNGEISEVYQCYQDQYLNDFRIVANYCKRYIMESGKLAYILTQFENVSVDKLKEFYEKSYGENKRGDLYYSKDFKTYSKIYLSKTGSATIELRKTDSKQLSLISKEKNDELSDTELKIAAEEARKAYKIEQDKTKNENNKETATNFKARYLITKPKPLTDSEEEGIVVVEIVVDEKGNVIKATPGAKGSTTQSPKLYSKAQKAALTVKFNASPEVKEQKGTYTFVFTLE